jgi:peptidoglycan/xylan/chitin deacetylase (PgdA/CDA1 family)
MQWHESGKKKAVTFSYDDGTVQDGRLIDLFQKYGIKGTFNLCSDGVRVQGDFHFKDDEIGQWISAFQ